MDALAWDREVLGRLCDRLRATSDVALARERDALDGRSVAVAVHDLCQWAVQRQGLEDSVPLLHPLASGDQLAVIGREFLGWAGSEGEASGLTEWRAQVDLIRRAI